ncbi:MAG: hypothetical protein R3292_07625 [Alcanivorax sp.]|nr:hypothetical protein [Alcanivorax sp.]
MKPFAMALAILTLASVLLLGGYFTGYWRWQPQPVNGLLVLHQRNTQGEPVVRIRLYDSQRRSRWYLNDEDYRLDIRRRGPTLFWLDLTLHSHGDNDQRDRHVRTAIQLPLGEQPVASVALPGGALPRQHIVIERLP